jgi:hypothetical protein
VLCIVVVIVIIITIIIIKRLHLGAVFLLLLFQFDMSPVTIDITGIPVVPRNFKNYSQFRATRKNSPPTGCVSAANRSCEDVDILRKPVTSLNQILR